MAAFNGLLAALLAAVVCATVSAQGSADWEAFKAVSYSNLDFANSLYKVVSHKEGNLFFSPTSIHTILALTSLGARGSTAHQMFKGLYLPDDKQKIQDGFRHLTGSLNEDNTTVKKIANRIFTDSRFPPTPEFAQVSSADFHSSSETVDFQHKHDEARVKINTWVEDNTEHKIKDLLSDGSVDSNTAMVLVNAIYFNGSWDSPFSETTPLPFYISEDASEDVPMMYQFGEGKFPYFYSEDLNADILEIPYAGKTVSMMVILPKEKTGLKDVETKLAGIKLRSVTHAQVSYPNVHLRLPKFKLEETLDLEDNLVEMGMGEMFSDRADFSGLAAGPIKVSKVIHKAFIEVNEKGTEAAAATAGGNNRVGLMKTKPAQEINFKADHPFIFMLVNTEACGGDTLSFERSVLFMGRFDHPQ